MKKNPLLIARTNANKPKIARAKKIFGLALFLLMAITTMIVISVPNHGLAAAGTVLSFLPLAASVRGTMKDNGIDETEEQFKARGDKAEDPATYVQRYLKFIEDKINELSKQDSPIKDELKKFLDVVSKLKTDSDVIGKLKDEVAKTNLAIEALKESSRKETKDDIKSQVTAWVEKNKDSIKAAKGGAKAHIDPLVLKLNSPMTPANTYNSSNYLPIPTFIPGATEIVRVQPTFWDYIPKGRTGSATIVWVNKKNAEGAAGFIGPGVAKPGVSFEIATETSNAKKIAASEKCAIELLDDIDGMASWLEMELLYQLDAETNDKLMDGVSSSTVPAGIQTISVSYSLSGVSTTDPNNWDAIIAAATQLRSGNLEGPITAFVNPVDYANMQLTKAISQGQPFLAPNPGVTIVQDNNIPAGSLQIAILNYYKILVYKDITISYGWENDDFTKNLITAIAERRIHQYFSENHTGFAIFDTFDNIKTAIAAP